MFTTRSVRASNGQAISAPSSVGGVPGFQKRNWLSGSNSFDSRSSSMPENPGPGSSASSRRAVPVLSVRTFTWWTTRALPGRRSRART
jgi:hypothetical protein